MKSNRFPYNIILFTVLFVLFSCRTIKETDIIGCYQHYLKSDVGTVIEEKGRYFKLYGFTVLHSNHTYSSFAAKKNDCDAYKYDENHYPVSGIWFKKGKHLYLKSYVQDSSKAWFRAIHDIQYRYSDSLIVYVHHFYTQVLDSGCKKIRVSAGEYDTQCETYSGKDGVFCVKKKDVNLKEKFYIDAFYRYQSLGICLSDTSVNRLDIYLLPDSKNTNSMYIIKPDYLEQRSFYWDGIFPKIISFKKFKIN